MDASDDIMESARPPKPRRPTDPHAAERRKSLLLHTVAVAALATAVFTGITAWETHEHRRITQTVYCNSLSFSPDEEKLSDLLGC